MRHNEKKFRNLPEGRVANGMVDEMADETGNETGDETRDETRDETNETRQMAAGGG